MKRIAEILRDSKTPLIIVRKVGETASGETKLHAFTDGADGYAIVSNSTELHSPSTGEKLAPVAGVEQTVNADDINELSEMTVGEQAGYTLLMDPDLAFDLAGETIKSPVDGTDVVVQYKSSETAEDESEEETTETESEEDTTEEEVPADETVEGEGSEEESSDEESEEEIESIDDSEALDESVSEEDESTEGEEEDTEAGEDLESEEEEILEEDATLVLEASFDNKEEPLRLVQVDSNGSEVAVFAGANYLGAMHRSKAANNIQPLFDNGQKLYRSFKAVVTEAANLRTSEVASFGFEPSTVRLPVRKLVTDAIENAKAEVASAAKADRAALSARYKKVLGIALLGMNKGFFEGASVLVDGPAQALKNAGVVNAEATVRKTLADAADAYTVAVVEKAEELLNKSDDYLTGVSESITKTEFKGDVAPAVTTVFNTPAKPEAETAGFRSAFKTPQKGGNRFTGIVGGLGRR